MQLYIYIYIYIYMFTWGGGQLVYGQFPKIQGSDFLPDPGALNSSSILLV